MRVWVVSQYDWLIEHEYIIAIADSEEKANNMKDQIINSRDFDELNSVEIDSYEVL